MKINNSILRLLTFMIFLSTFIYSIDGTIAQPPAVLLREDDALVVLDPTSKIHRFPTVVRDSDGNAQVIYYVGPEEYEKERKRLESIHAEERNLLELRRQEYIRLKQEADDIVRNSKKSR